MIEQHLIEWQEMCKTQGKSKFADGHFDTLLMEGLSPEKIKLMSQYLSHPKEMEFRLNNLLNTTESAVVDIASRQEQLINFAFQDMEQKLSICHIEENTDAIELIEKAKKIAPKFVGRTEYELIFDETREYNEIDETVTDYLFDLIDEQESYVTHELIESCYGYAGDYDIILYVLAPYLNSKYNSNYYYDLWRSGSVYLVSDHGVLIWDRFAEQVQKNGLSDTNINKE